MPVATVLVLLHKNAGYAGVLLCRGKYSAMGAGHVGSKGGNVGHAIVRVRSGETEMEMAREEETWHASAISSLCC